ncbi:MAG: transcriptional regulator [Telluria sp.]
MTEQFFPFDPADSLDSFEAIEVYLADAFEVGDASCLGVAFDDVVRAMGRERVPEDVRFSGQELQSLCTPENLTLKAALAILGAAGLKLTVVSASVADAKSDSRIDDDADLEFQAISGH